MWAVLSLGKGDHPNRCFPGAWHCATEAFWAESFHGKSCSSWCDSPVTRRLGAPADDAAEGSPVADIDPAQGKRVHPSVETDAPGMGISLYGRGYAAFYERYYTQWVRRFSPILEQYLAESLIGARSLLDLCCGTGTGETAAAFLCSGWDVYGVDLSAAMLDRARLKLAAHIDSRRLVLIQADMCEFALTRPVSAAVCLDGALNHLLSPSLMGRICPRGLSP
jgi:Methyltransferase domain